MNAGLNKDDAEKVKLLIATRQHNNDVSWMLSDYLNESPTFITPELMREVSAEPLQDELMYTALMAGACGLDTESSETDRFLFDKYLTKAVRKLDVQRYSSNLYYKNIVVPRERNGRWLLDCEKYLPYEAFIYNDITLDDRYREIQNVGFFDSEFCFPAVLQDNREWMAIKPSEIETMQPAIDAVAGNVVTFGLGLGYFAYMASLKSSVSRVTVVETDQEVIDLFTKCILPKFADRHKIEIIESDAFDYIKTKMPAAHYDYAFVDLWHDASDGLPIYLKIKKMEHLCPSTEFLYWIENTLLSALRWNLFDSIVDSGKSYDEIERNLSNEFLRKVAAAQITTLLH